MFDSKRDRAVVRKPVWVGALGVLVLLASLLPASPAFAASTVSMTVTTVSRSTTSAYLTIDVDVTASNYQGYSDTCTPAAGHNCTAGIQVKIASTGDWENVLWNDGMWSYPDPKTVNFSRTWYVAQVSEVRAFLSGGNGTTYSSAQAVTDWSPTPTVSAVVNASSRSSYGMFDYDVTVTASDYEIPGAACESSFGSTCDGGVQVKLLADNSVQTIAYGNFRTKPYPYSQNFTGSTDLPSVSQIRAYVSGPGGTLYGAWQSISDTQPGPTVALTINSFSRSTSSGLASYDVTISASYYQLYSVNICRGSSSPTNCHGGVQALYAGDEDPTDLADSNTFENKPYPRTQNFTGTSAREVTALRPYVRGEFGSIYGEWTDVDDWTPVPSVELDINSYSRPTGSGIASYNFTVTGEYYQRVENAPCTYSYPENCRGGVQVKYAGDSVATDLTDTNSFYNKNFPYSATFSGTSEQEITDVRAYISGDAGRIYSDWQDVEDWTPEADVDLAVNSYSRPTTTGIASYDFTVSAEYYQLAAAEICRYSYPENCNAGVQVKYASDDDEHTIAASNTFLNKTSPHSVNFTGTLQDEVTQVRGYIAGDLGIMYTDWQDVDDWTPEASVTFTIDNFDRPTATGVLDFDFTITGSYYQLPSAATCSNYYPYRCQGGVEAKYAGDNDPENLITGSYSGFFNQPYPHSISLGSSSTGREIEEVRAYIDGEYGRLYSEWQSVDDWTPEPSVALTVHKLWRDSASGDLNWDVDIQSTYVGYYYPDSVCASYFGNRCHTLLQAQYADGTIANLESHEDYPPPYSLSTHLDGHVSVDPIVAVRAAFTGRNGSEVYGEIYSAWTDVSDFLSNETIGGSNAAEKNCVCAHGDPVNTATGEFFLPVSDLSISGVGPAIGVSRTYSSTLAAQDGPFGYGWSASFGARIDVVQGGDPADPLPRVVDVVQENGATVRFTEQPDHTYAAPERVFATLEYNDTSDIWTFVRQAVETLTFDDDGGLLATIDPNGNTVSYGYTSGHVTTITASGGREIELTWSANRVVGVEDSAGREASYAYDSTGNLVSVIGVDGAESEHGYDSRHLMTALTRPGGGVTTNVYDSHDRVVSQTDPLNRELTFSYDGATTTTTGWDSALTVETYNQGRVVSQTFAAGTALATTSSFEYDAAGNLLRMTDPLSQSTTSTYDDRGNTLTITNPLSQTTTWTYNSLNRVTSINDPLSRTTTSTYDGAGNLTSTTSPGGRTTTYVVNVNGTVASVEDPRGKLTTLQYDSAGQFVSRMDADGRTSFVTYDAAGFVATQSDADGNVTSFARDPAGRVLTVTDPLSGVTTLTYDADGQLLATENASGNTWSSAYDAAGQVTSTTDARGKSTTFTYTDAGYLETATDPEARTTTRTYDLLGRMSTIADAANNVTAYSYDGKGNLLATTLPSTATTAATYDAVGQTISSTDGNGKTTIYGYDAAGQLVSVVDPLARETSTAYTDDGQVDTVVLPDLSAQSYTYNENGQVASFTDPDGHVTSYDYSDAGLLIQRTAPGNVVTSYDYDEAGRLRTTTLPDETTITNSYDDGSRLTERDYSAPGSTDVGFTYDSVGARLSMSDASGTTTYSYNANAQLTSETNGANQTLSYSYTDSGLLETVTYPGSDSVDYAYDTSGRLATVTDWNSNTTSFTWTVDGQRSAQTDPNGVVQTRTYDGAGQVTEITTADALTSLAQYGYSYDDAGQLTGDITTDPIWSAVSHTYTYDALSQVLSSNDGISTVDYGATSGGKLTTIGGQTLAYDSAQRLTDITPATGPATSFAYDSNGSRTNRTVAASSPNPAQATDYTYDAALNLETVTLPGGTTPTVTYVSDGDGLRQTRTESTTATFLWSTADELPILLDDGTSRYIYGASLTPIAQIDSLGTTTYLHDDLLGSVRLITDGTGTIVGSTEYDTYGNRLQHTGAVDSLFGYTGNWTDPTTELLYLRARDYDPGTGQFVTVDPMQDETRQPYAYVSNNPLELVDPTGLQWDDNDGETEMVAEWIIGGLGRNNIYDESSALVQHLKETDETRSAVASLQVQLISGNVGADVIAGYDAGRFSLYNQNFDRDFLTYLNWFNASDEDRLRAAVGSYSLYGRVVGFDPICRTAVVEFSGYNEITLGSAIGPSTEMRNALNFMAEATGVLRQANQYFTWREMITY